MNAAGARNPASATQSMTACADGATALVGAGVHP